MRFQCRYLFIHKDKFLLDIYIYILSIELIWLRDNLKTMIFGNAKST